MSRTAAAELALLKAAFPDWSIRPVQPSKGAGFTAHPRLKGGGSRWLYAPTLTELEHEPWQVVTGRQGG